MALTIKHRVSLDLSLNSVQVTVPFRKGDGPVHEVIFSIRNASEVVELPVGTLATICIYNGANDGSGVADMCTVDHVNHTISYIPKKEALSVAGSVRCDLRVIGTDGGSLGSPKFIFFIDESMADVTEEEISTALRANDSWGIIQSAKANALIVEASKEAAVASKEAAVASAGAAATSERNARQSELAAKASEETAVASAVAAATSEGNARQSELAAKASEERAVASAGAATVAAADAVKSAEDSAVYYDYISREVSNLINTINGIEEELVAINEGGVE